MMIPLIEAIFAENFQGAKFGKIDKKNGKL